MAILKDDHHVELYLFLSFFPGCVNGLIQAASRNQQGGKLYPPKPLFSFLFLFISCSFFLFFKLLVQDKRRVYGEQRCSWAKSIQKSQPDDE